MSYNLLAEASGELDWDAVHRELQPELKWVEVFPIPRQTASGSDAIGLSIPAKAASEESYREACRIVRILNQEFGMTLVDLYSSCVLDPATSEQFRKNFLG